MISDKSNAWTGSRKLGDGGGKRRNALMAGLLVLAVLLLGVLVFRQIGRLSGDRPEAWVATGPLAAGTLLTAENLERIVTRLDRLPDGAIKDLSRLLDRRLRRGKQPGQLFVSADFASNGTPAERARKLAELLPPGRVLTPVPVQIASIIMDELSFGDRFEIVASGRGGRPGERNTSVVASDAYFIAWVDPTLLANGGARREGGEGLLSGLMTIPGRAGVGGGGSTSATRMLLGLFPRDVLPVTEAQADGATLNLVLHGRHEVEQGQLLVLPSSSSSKVELIAGASRESVALKP